MKDSAAGADGWAGRDVARLPDAFYALLADVWNCTLTTGTIPTPWLHIRTVFIEKPDGGLRPISIASAFWRLGISAILHGLQTWVDQWAIPQLRGGFRGRNPLALHHTLKEAIQQALTGAREPQPT